MGIRDRLRKKVRKSAQRGKRERSTDSRVSEKRRRQLAKLKAALAAADGDAPSRDDEEARDQFERAERTAAAGPVFNATLDPSATPEAVEGLASGKDPRASSGESVGAPLRERERREQATMEELVLGTGVEAPESDDQAGTLEDFVTGSEPDEDDDGLFFGGY